MVEAVRIAGLEEEHRTAVVHIALEAVVLRMVTVEGEGTLPVDWDYEEEVRMAAAEAEGTLVVEAVEGMDCVKGLRMVVAEVVGSPGYTGPAVHTLPVAAAVTEAADLIPSYHPANTLRGGPRSVPLAHIRGVVQQAHHSPAGVDIHERGIGSAEAAGILLSSSE